MADIKVQIIVENGRAKAVLTDTEQAFRNFSNTLAGQGALGLKTINSLDAELTKLKLSFDALRDIGTAFIGFEIIKNVTSSLIEAQIAVQQIHFSLVAATGSAQAAANEFEFISNSAARLGLSLQQTASSYGSFLVSANAAKVSLKDTHQLFLATSEAATVFHLSGQRLHSVFYALEQMMSMGVIRTQELKIQLGQSLPGAYENFMNAVRGRGEDFQKMLLTGALDMKTYAAVLAKAIRDTFAPEDVETASQGLNANLGRMQTAVFNFKKELSSGVFEEMASSSVKTLTNLLNIINEKLSGGFDKPGQGLTANLAVYTMIGGAMVAASHGAGILVSKLKSVTAEINEQYGLTKKQVVANAEKAAAELATSKAARDQARLDLAGARQQRLDTNREIGELNKQYQAAVSARNTAAAAPGANITGSAAALALRKEEANLRKVEAATLERLNVLYPQQQSNVHALDAAKGKLDVTTKGLTAAQNANAAAIVRLNLVSTALGVTWNSLKTVGSLLFSILGGWPGMILMAVTAIAYLVTRSSELEVSLQKLITARKELNNLKGDALAMAVKTFEHEQKNAQIRVDQLNKEIEIARKGPHKTETYADIEGKVVTVDITENNIAAKERERDAILKVMASEREAAKEKVGQSAEYEALQDKKIEAVKQEDDALKKLKASVDDLAHAQGAKRELTHDDPGALKVKWEAADAAALKTLETTKLATLTKKELIAAEDAYATATMTSWRLLIDGLTAYYNTEEWLRKRNRENTLAWTKKGEDAYRQIENGIAGVDKRTRELTTSTEGNAAAVVKYVKGMEDLNSFRAKELDAIFKQELRKNKDPKKEDYLDFVLSSEKRATALDNLTGAIERQEAALKALRDAEMKKAADDARQRIAEIVAKNSMQGMAGDSNGITPQERLRITNELKKLQKTLLLNSGVEEMKTTLPWEITFDLITKPVMLQPAENSIANQDIKAALADEVEDVTTVTEAAWDDAQARANAKGKQVITDFLAQFGEAQTKDATTKLSRNQKEDKIREFQKFVDDYNAQVAAGAFGKLATPIDATSDAYQQMFARILDGFARIDAAAEQHASSMSQFVIQAQRNMQTFAADQLYGLISGDAQAEVIQKAEAKARKVLKDRGLKEGTDEYNKELKRMMDAVDATAGAFDNLADAFGKMIKKMMSELASSQLLEALQKIAKLMVTVLFPSKSSTDFGGMNIKPPTEIFGDLGNAEGGHIRGPGTATSDSIPAWLSDGEYVIKAAAVQKYGVSFFEQLNKMKASPQIPGIRKFAEGGLVGGSRIINNTTNGGGTQVNIVNNTGQEARTENTRGPNGEDIINVVIGKVASDIRNNGPVGQSIQSTFGAQRRGVNRG